MIKGPVPNRIVKEISGLSKAGVARSEGLFLAEGLKVVDELLQSGLTTEMVIVRKGFDTGGLKIPSGPKVFESSESDFRKMSSLTTPAGILALAHRPVNIPPSLPDKGTWYLALDRISDPGNMGTIIRTAEWFGIKNIFAAPGSVDFYAPKVVQSAMGSLFRMSVSTIDLYDLIAGWKSKTEFACMAATAAGVPVAEIHMPDGGLLIIGNESHGVSEPLLNSASIKVAIPRHRNSMTESLNAAVACGVLLSYIPNK